MNHRERIKATLAFERPDQLPCHESPWEQTLKTWRAQGMLAEVSLEDYFDFDLAFMYLDTSPRFTQRILKQEGGMITYAVALKHPERIGLAIPIAAALPEPLLTRNRTSAKTPPIRAFHGQADTVIPWTAAQKTHQMFKSQGYDATLRSYGGVHHTIPAEMQNEIYNTLAEAVARLKPSNSAQPKRSPETKSDTQVP